MSPVAPTSIGLPTIDTGGADIAPDVRRVIADHYVALSRYVADLLECRVHIATRTAVEVTLHVCAGPHQFSAVSTHSDAAAAVRAAFVAARARLQGALRAQRNAKKRHS